MSEEKAIKQSPTPRTQQSLARDLRALGVEKGITLMVHSSLNALGWVSGRSVAVIRALMEVLTREGTLVMPTHSTDYSDPARWQNPPVPESWWQTIRDSMPAFEPEVTPSRQMGLIPETFRKWPGVLRSNHPAMSFAAWGKHAQFVTSDHSLDDGLGDESPLGRIYELDGYVLLLGVGYDSNTSFHLAEYRAPGAVPESLGAPILINGRRQWVEYKDIEIDSDLFPQIGGVMDDAGFVRQGQIGSATTRLFSQPKAVDFAQEWITHSRNSAKARTTDKHASTESSS